MGRRKSPHRLIKMDWISLKVSDVEAALNKAQLEALKAESIRTLNRDVAFEIIADVVTRIRAEISAGEISSLDADHSRIPPELKEPALRLIVEALQLRVPAMELSASQMKHADLARETIARIARGELPVSRPRLAIRTSTHKKGVFAKSAPQKANRKNMEAL